MIVRSLIVTGMFALLGAGVLLRPSAKPLVVDESWLEKQYPTVVGKYTTQPAQDGSTGHSYRMDETTYATLKPYGIVAKTMSDGVHTFDVVNIAGDSEESFHNPLLCFQAQGWQTTGVREITIPTKHHGEVRATIASASHDGGLPQYALYTYEGPTSAVASPPALKDQMVKTEFRTGKVQFATFFRFMSLTQNLTEDQVIGFAQAYLDASPTRPIEKLRS